MGLSTTLIVVIPNAQEAIDLGWDLHSVPAHPASMHCQLGQSCRDHRGSAVSLGDPAAKSCLSHTRCADLVPGTPFGNGLAQINCTVF